MGFSDRDYNRPNDGDRPAAPLGQGGLPPVVKWLLFLNAAIFLFAPGFSGITQPINPQVLEFGVMQPRAVLQEAQLGRLVSSMFLHANFMHILFNMFVLFQFGPWLERHLGSRHFLAFYLLCGIAGGLAMCLFSFFPPFRELWTSPAVGASGAIYGVLLGLAVIAPNARIMLLIPPIPMSLRTFALVMLGIGLFTVGNRGANYGGELAHLGGGALGALLAWKPQLLAWVGGGTRSAGPRPRTHRGRRIVDADVIDESHRRMRQRIDEILDKVSADGLHSLSQEERETLETYRQEVNR